MAQDDGSSWWSNWTSGILQNVREKTSTALEFVQNDLSEFVTTIQHDTSIVIADSATAVNSNLKVDESEKDATSGKLKQGFSNLLTSISSTLHHAAESNTEVASSQHDGRTDEERSRTSVMPVYDRTQARLQEVQTNPETYRNDPNGEVYRIWCETFDLDAKKGEISGLLVNNPEVRRLYTKFVPSIQSHSTFWHRYFYKVHELELENQRLAAIVARASQKDSHEQDLGWDDEDDDDFIASSTTKEDVSNPIADSTINTNDKSNDKLEEENPTTRPEIVQEKEKCDTKFEEREVSVLSSRTTISDKSSPCNEEHFSETGQNKDSETKTIDKNNIAEQFPCVNSEVGQSNDVLQHSSVLVNSAESKSEEYKSDSSDSNSWIRVSDKEGSSTNSSSSVIVVNEKEKEQDLTWDDNEDSKDKDDDDDFGLNEDISTEDVEKLVQSITANELDSDEDDWEDWE